MPAGSQGGLGGRARDVGGIAMPPTRACFSRWQPLLTGAAGLTTRHLGTPRHSRVLLQVAAFADGRSAVHEYDCLLLEFVLGQRPDDAHVRLKSAGLRWGGGGRGWFVWLPSCPGPLCLPRTVCSSSTVCSPCPAADPLPTICLPCSFCPSRRRSRRSCWRRLPRTRACSRRSWCSWACLAAPAVCWRPPMRRWAGGCTEVDGMGRAALGGYPGLPGLLPQLWGGGICKGSLTA